MMFEIYCTKLDAV